MSDNNEPQDKGTATKAPDKTENGKDKIDPANMFNIGFKEGKTKALENAQKEFDQKLIQEFGSANFEEIKEKLTPKKKEPSEDFIKKMEVLAAENQQLKQEQEKMKLDNEKRAKLSDIEKEVNRQNPLNKDAAETVVNRIYNNFDIKDGKLFPKGSDTPHFTKGNEMGTLENVIAEMKTNEFSFAFKKETGFQHINDQAGGEGITNYKFKDADFYKKGFKEAVKQSGQWDHVKQGKPIDLTKLSVDISQFGFKI
jgi:hypothetical protein